jgi:hypothetical protein
MATTPTLFGIRSITSQDIGSAILGMDAISQFARTDAMTRCVASWKNVVGTRQARCKRSVEREDS